MVSSPARHRICPTAEELCQETAREAVCSVAGCGKVFSHYASMQMHLTLTHRVETGVKYGRLGSKDRSEPREYYCPSHRCVYNEGGNRYFKSMKLLKQHYLKVHAEKKHVCPRCQFGFGIERDFKRHLLTCGVIYTCVSCGCPYSTKEALQMHCLRKCHQLPAHIDSKQSKKGREAEALEQPRVSGSSAQNRGGTAECDPVQCPSGTEGGSSPVPPSLVLLPPHPARPVNVSLQPLAEQRQALNLHTSPGCNSSSSPAGPKLRRIMPKLAMSAVTSAMSAVTSAPASYSVVCPSVAAASAAELRQGATCGRRRISGTREVSSRSVGVQAGTLLVAPGVPNGTAAADGSAPLLSLAASDVGGTVGNVLASLTVGQTAAVVDAHTEPMCAAGSHVAVGSSPPTFGSAVDSETQTLLDELSSMSESMSTQTFSSFLLSYRFSASPRPSADSSASGTHADRPTLPLSSSATVGGGSVLLASADGTSDFGGPTAAASAQPTPVVTLPLGLPSLDECAGRAGASLKPDYIRATPDNHRTATAAVPAGGEQLHEQYCGMSESETQTLLDELSTFTENMSTQTFVSFLFDSHSATSFGTQTQLLSDEDDSGDDVSAVCTVAFREAAEGAAASQAAKLSRRADATVDSGGNYHSLPPPAACLSLLTGGGKGGGGGEDNRIAQPLCASVDSQDALRLSTNLASVQPPAATAAVPREVNVASDGRATAACRCKCLTGACGYVPGNIVGQAIEPPTVSRGRCTRCSVCDRVADGSAGGHLVDLNRCQAAAASMDAVASDFGSTSRERLYPAACLRGVDAAMQTNLDGDPSGAFFRQSSTQTVDLGDIFVSMETQTVDLAVQSWTQTDNDWTLF